MEKKSSLDNMIFIVNFIFIKEKYSFLEKNQIIINDCIKNWYLNDIIRFLKYGYFFKKRDIKKEGVILHF